MFHENAGEDPPRHEQARVGTLESEPKQASDSAEILERTLARIGSALEQLEQRVEHEAPTRERAAVEPEKVAKVVELDRSLREVGQRLEDSLNQLHGAVERLSNGVSYLVLVVDWLEALPNELSSSLGRSPAPCQSELTLETKPGVPEKAGFRPGDEGLRIVIAGLPSFQCLMEMRRALSDLPAAESASVVGYKNAEACLEVRLHEPLSADEIVEGLRKSTGHELITEQARPEALRLRLRFASQDASRAGSNR